MKITFNIRKNENELELDKILNKLKEVKYEK